MALGFKPIDFSRRRGPGQLPRTTLFIKREVQSIEVEVWGHQWKCIKLTDPSSLISRGLLRDGSFPRTRDLCSFGEHPVDGSGASGSEDRCQPEQPQLSQRYTAND